MGKTRSTSGDVYVNGVKKGVAGYVLVDAASTKPEESVPLTNGPIRYKMVIGYVPQDDIVLPDLTVRENILHSARIRLPSTWAEREIQAHVDILISCLKLSHVQHNRVGSYIKPTISGGQRKRVSIGIELVAAPMALFLDEPTSGLDSTSALSIINLLKALSQLGVTVVSIIHQPRTDIFYAFDDLLLLSAGRRVYQGHTVDAPGYFKDLGYEFRADTNPADIIMDIITGQGDKHKLHQQTTYVPDLIQHWSDCQATAPAVEPMVEGPSGAVPKKQEISLQKLVALRGAPWPKQVWFCFLRSLKQQVRQATSFYLEVAVGGVAGLLIGLSVFELRGDLFQGSFRKPYTPLSSALNYTLVPQLGLLCALAIGRHWLPLLPLQKEPISN